MNELRYEELRQATLSPSRIDDINRLLPQLSRKAAPVTRESMCTLLEAGTRVFVALDGERIVGTVLLPPMIHLLVGRKDWIEDVVVDQEYRGRGVADELMEMAEQASRLRGADSVNLTSSVDRQAARRLYSGRGYKQRSSLIYRLVHRVGS